IACPRPRARTGAAPRRVAGPGPRGGSRRGSPGKQNAPRWRAGGSSPRAFVAAGRSPPGAERSPRRCPQVAEAEPPPEHARRRPASDPTAPPDEPAGQPGSPFGRSQPPGAAERRAETGHQQGFVRPDPSSPAVLTDDLAAQVDEDLGNVDPDWADVEA